MSKLLPISTPHLALSFRLKRCFSRYGIGVSTTLHAVWHVLKKLIPRIRYGGRSIAAIEYGTRDTISGPQSYCVFIFRFLEQDKLYETCVWLDYPIGMVLPFGRYLSNNYSSLRGWYMALISDSVLIGLAAKKCKRRITKTQIR